MSSTMQAPSRSNGSRHLSIRAACAADRAYLDTTRTAAGFRPICHGAGWYGCRGRAVIEPAASDALVATNERGDVVAVGQVQPSTIPGSGMLTILSRAGLTDAVLASGLVESLAEVARNRGYCLLTTLVPGHAQATIGAFRAAGLPVRACLSFAGTTELELWLE